MLNLGCQRVVRTESVGFVDAPVPVRQILLDFGCTTAQKRIIEYVVVASVRQIRLESGIELRQSGGSTECRVRIVDGRFKTGIGVPGIDQNLRVQTSQNSSVLQSDRNRLVQGQIDKVLREALTGGSRGSQMLGTQRELLNRVECVQWRSAIVVTNSDVSRWSEIDWTIERAFPTAFLAVNQVTATRNEDKRQQDNQPGY